jgi:antitoxin (DNA-binding transcriptional repressor) of toxin-antitoxin stability system
LVDAGRVKRVSLRRAKTELSRLLKEVALGEQVVLLRGTEPVALLVPYRARKKRQFGRFKGRLRIGEDFDAPLPPEMAQAFGL